MVASLNHPNIGAIYAFEENDSRQALVLELGSRPISIVLNWQAALNR